MDLKLKMAKLTDEINEMKEQCRQVRTDLVSILGELNAADYFQSLIALDSEKKSIAESELEIGFYENEIEKLAATQYPKDTDYNVIGVVKQYITSIRRRVIESAKNNSTEMNYANERAKMCVKSLKENYPTEIADKMVTYANLLDVTIQKQESAKRQESVYKTIIKLTEKNNAKIRSLGTMYVDCFNSAYTKTAELVKTQNEYNNTMKK